MSLPPRIALIGPNFFSYVDSICLKMAKRGFDVESFDEKHNNSVIGKAAYRLGIYKFFNGRIRNHLDSLAEKLISSQFDDVLLINTEAPDRIFVQSLVQAGLRVHIYMWDSAINKPGFIEYVDLLQGKASFDPGDCNNLNLKYIPLFAEDIFSSISSKERPNKSSLIYDISFCGTLHSNRAKLFTQLDCFAKKKRLRLLLLLYFHTKWMFALKSIFFPSNFKFIMAISSKIYSKAQISDLFKKSRFVIDIPHPSQSGLTARTFEVLRSGSRLITFNSCAISLLPSSLTNRIHVVEQVADLEQIDFENSESPAALSSEDDYYLSLDRFVDDILSLIMSQAMEKEIQ